MMKWIDVKEKLPLHDSRYLVTENDDGYLTVEIRCYAKDLSEVDYMLECKSGWYYDDDEWGTVVLNDDEVIAWQPLPEAYGEEK